MQGKSLSDLLSFQPALGESVGKGRLCGRAWEAEKEQMQKGSNRGVMGLGGNSFLSCDVANKELVDTYWPQVSEDGGGMANRKVFWRRNKYITQVLEFQWVLVPKFQAGKCLDLDYFCAKDHHFVMCAVFLLWVSLACWKCRSLWRFHYIPLTNQLLPTFELVLLDLLSLPTLAPFMMVNITQVNNWLFFTREVQIWA